MKSDVDEQDRASMYRTSRVSGSTTCDFHEIFKFNIKTSIQIFKHEA